MRQSGNRQQQTRPLLHGGGPGERPACGHWASGTWDKAGKIVHLGVYRDWEELDRLMKAFNVSRCVVDALPETRNARAFAERHQGQGLFELLPGEARRAAIGGMSRT